MLIDARVSIPTYRCARHRQGRAVAKHPVATVACGLTAIQRHRPVGVQPGRVRPQLKVVQRHRRILARSRPYPVAAAPLHRHVAKGVIVEPRVAVLKTHPVTRILHHAVRHRYVALHHPDAKPVSRSFACRGRREQNRRTGRANGVKTPVDNQFAPRTIIP